MSACKCRPNWHSRQENEFRKQFLIIMITLTGQQTDALTELVNISFGLTAAKLSEISGNRVLLKAPIIAVHPVDSLAKELGSFITGHLATVHQVFNGPVSGDAILILDHEDAVRLSNLIVEEHLQSLRFDSAAGEVLTEVGNMLLSACLGVFGNLLQVHVTFSIPRLHLDSLKQFLSSISIAGDELRYAVLITASFKIREQGVDGRIVIALGVFSFERLIEAVERWERTQC
jgi:chemotaxis protein CheC